MSGTIRYTHSAKERGKAFTWHHYRIVWPCGHEADKGHPGYWPKGERQNFFRFNPCPHCQREQTP